jgi:hypothetical protein
MLRMTALTGECCGAGRDQLVYNLQFTRFHDLQNRVYEDIRPTRETVILVTEAANFGLLGPLSEDDYTRSVSSRRVFSPRYESVEDFVKRTGEPTPWYFMAFPNVDNREAIATLASAFAERRLTRYRWRGYGLDVYRFSSAVDPPTTGSPGGGSTAPETVSGRSSDGIPRPPS